MKKKKILAFMGYYLPGFKSGGPVRSLSNMVDHLADSAEFYIVTRDKDLGDSRPYEGIDGAENWIEVGEAKVFYVSSRLSFEKIAALIEDVSPDLYYLNSFFDFEFSILPNIYLKWKRVGAGRVVLAPRGEFSAGALSLKYWKKKPYIWLAKIFSFYRDVNFHASTDHERNEIRLGFRDDVKISVASDLPALNLRKIFITPRGDAQGIRLVFLARVTPMKNIDYALKILQEVSRPVEFHIYGPIEDQEYWLSCSQIISRLPKNISVKSFGAKEQAEVLDILAEYDLLFLPSRGENYCHVISEALSVGTRVLVSDKTPWRDLRNQGFGWDLPLSDPGAFVAVINSFELLDAENDFRVRDATVRAYEQLLLNSNSVIDNKLLFDC